MNALSHYMTSTTIPWPGGSASAEGRAAQLLVAVVVGSGVCWDEVVQGRLSWWLSLHGNVW